MAAGSPTEVASAAARGPGGKALNPNTTSQAIFMKASPLLVPLFTVVVSIEGAR